jgi:2-iminobutanoate/2-iminopropanoate deaminase
VPRPRAFNPANPRFFGPIASVALRHGDTVYTSGLVGIDFRTGQPVSGTDFGAQVRKALDNLKEVLESAGSSLDRVLSVRCWVSDWANWPAMNDIYVTYFTHDPKPVRATVEAGLLPPYMFEIQATAYVGRAARTPSRAGGRRHSARRRSRAARRS